MKRLTYTILAALWTGLIYLTLKLARTLVKMEEDDFPSNCLLWAIKHQTKEGGRLILLDSKYGSWYHCWYEDPSGVRSEFNPRKSHRKYRMLKVGLPPPVFNGSVRIIPHENLYNPTHPPTRLLDREDL